MTYKYGTFSSLQFSETIDKLRKQIYFLLLIVDPKTKDEYEGVDIQKAIENVQYKIAGMNSLLSYPQELVTVSSLLERALNENNSSDFQYWRYRKLILDAGNEILKIKEVV